MRARLRPLAHAACAAAIVALGISGCGPSTKAHGNGNTDATVDDDGGGPTDGQTLPDGTGGDSGMQGCNPQDFILEQAPPPEVFLVIDRSGSMLEDGSQPNMTKWDELVAAVQVVLQQFEGQIQFGVLMYPAGNECATSGPQVQVGLYNRLAVLNELSATTPNGGTPTAAAVTNASHALEYLGPTGSEKFLILATDGGPNCNYFLQAQPCSCNLTDQNYCCTNHPSGECYFGQNCLDDAHTVQILDEVRTNSGIDTFVIGLAGTAEYAETLNEMAQAGGRPQANPPYYYDASNQQALTNALTAIAGNVISCVINLDEAPQYPDYVHIYVDGQEVARDPNDGWDYTDTSHTAIEFYGAACDLLKDGNNHVVTATFACSVE